MNLNEVLGFDYLAFANQYVADQKSLTRELMYGIYFEDIDPVHGEMAVVQLLATLEPIGHILKDWSHEKQMQFLAFIWKHPREGTFKALSQFDPRYNDLIAGLKSYYYDIEDSERDAQDKSREFYREFTSFVEILAPAVDTLYGGVIKLLDELNEPVTKQDAIRFHADIQKGFKPFFENKHTYEDFLQFARIFGLYAYPPVFQNSPDEPTYIVDKIKNLKKILTGLLGLNRSLSTIIPQDMQSILSFVFTIITHLDGIKNPSKYKSGLTLFTCTIATYNKLLENEASLSSLVEAYKKLGTFLHCSTRDIPIIVFDQSDGEIFKKNSAYIATLDHHIIHVSKEEAVDLAKKHGCEKLIVTTPEGNFGYGGARNCQFLLTKYFHESELLLVVDDDMLIHDTNLISCALFGKQNRLAAEGFQYGRASKFNLFYWDLHDVLYAPVATQTFPVWVDSITRTGFSEQLMGPRICLNLPQGNEEAHLMTFAKEHTFLKPSFHLSGPRYPKGEIPTKPFVGLDSYLRKSLSYVLLLCLTEFFISPQSRLVPTILPWNEIQQPRSLKESIQFMIQTNEEVKRRFWQHMQAIFVEKKQEYFPFIQMIESIRNLDVDTVLATYEKQANLTADEKASLIKMGDVYKDLQKDVEQFWQLGSALCRDPNYAFTMPSKAFPVTQGLCLMINALARDGFKKGVSEMTPYLS